MSDTPEKPPPPPPPTDRNDARTPEAPQTPTEGSMTGALRIETSSHKRAASENPEASDQSGKPARNADRVQAPQATTEASMTGALRIETSSHKRAASENPEASDQSGKPASNADRVKDGGADSTFGWDRDGRFIVGQDRDGKSVVVARDPPPTDFEKKLQAGQPFSHTFSPASTDPPDRRPPIEEQLKHLTFDPAIDLPPSPLIRVPRTEPRSAEGTINPSDVMPVRDAKTQELQGYLLHTGGETMIKLDRNGNVVSGWGVERPVEPEAAYKVVEAIGDLATVADGVLFIKEGFPAAVEVLSRVLAKDAAKATARAGAEGAVREGGTRPVAWVQRLEPGQTFSSVPDPAFVGPDAESHLYVTDSQGRPAGFQGRLRLDPDNIRSSYQQEQVSGPMNREIKSYFGDAGEKVNASHLAARQHGGIGTKENLVPLPAGVNLKDISKLERSLTQRLENNEPTFLVVSVDYAGSTKIPQAVTYDVYGLQNGTLQKVESHAFIGSH